LQQSLQLPNQPDLAGFLYRRRGLKSNPPPSPLALIFAEAAMRPLFFVLVIFPLLELWLLFKVGAMIGALPTLGLVVASAMLGIAVLRRVGWRTLTRMDLRRSRGEPAGRELLDGFILALGGALLFLPGLIGDVLGLLFLLPPCRRWLGSSFLGRYAAGPVAANDSGPVTLEGEYRRED
jgi:UPF0716 protein FxsA